MLGHTLGTLAMFVYFPALCDSIVHDVCIYIYICLRMCGWLFTLYDGLSWLREWPSLVMRALDLVMWVCAQGDYRKCIFMLYCVHDHRGVIALIHVTKWHWFPRVCDMHQHAWHFEGFWLVTVWACQCTLYTQMWNPAGAPLHTKRETLPNFHCENGASPLSYSYVESSVRIAFCVLWRIWGETLPKFRHENKAKWCRIFAVEIWQQF